MQGTVPLLNVRAYLPTQQQANMFRVPARWPDQANAIAFRNLGINLLPRFDNANVQAPPVQLRGLTPTSHFSSPVDAFTFAAWSHPANVPLDADYVYLWSSYRHVQSASTALDRGISMYTNFRTFYGTDVCLYQSSNPSVMIVV